MPKRFHIVGWRQRQAQKDFAEVAARSHDEQHAALYLDDEFLKTEQLRIRERLIAIGVPLKPQLSEQPKQITKETR